MIKVMCGVRLGDGRELPAQLFCGTGVRPNLDLAKTAGLAINKGVLVDDRMASNDPFIFAAGDNTEHKGMLYGLWLPAKNQGSVAGTNSAGGDASFEGMAPSAMLKVLVLTFASENIWVTGKGRRFFSVHRLATIAAISFRKASFWELFCWVMRNCPVRFKRQWIAGVFLPKNPIWRHLNKSLRGKRQI